MECNIINIILYVLDSLRASNLSCYGYHRETSPNIDKLSREGVLFENAFAQSTWTRPSAASILTGLYPNVHKTNTREDKLTKNIPTIADILKSRGFYTIGLSAMGNVSSVLGFDRGFSKFIDLFRQESLTNKRATSTTKSEQLFFESKERVALPLAEDINECFFSQLNENITEPFFAFMWGIDTHAPFCRDVDKKQFYVDDSIYHLDQNKPTKIIQKICKRIKEEPTLSKDEITKKIDMYDSEIYYADQQIGRLIKRLQEYGILDDTMIIITADHGEGFGEYERASNHGYLPYDEIIKVPMIVKFPKIPELENFINLRIKSIVQLIDITPTILSIVGNFGKYKFQGRNLIPVIRTDKSLVDCSFSETQVFDYTSAFLSVRTKHYKYIKVIPPKWSLENIIKCPSHFFARQILRKLQGKNAHLYDLANDPFEKVNIIKKHKDIARKLDDKLAQWQKSNIEYDFNVKVEKTGNMDDEVKKHLKALGYH